MDEYLSPQARLARRNINILNITWSDKGRTAADVFYEFMYHPRPGQTKWCKTYHYVQGEHEDGLGYEYGYPVTMDDIYEALSEMVLSLRKELEG